MRRYYIDDMSEVSRHYFNTHAIWQTWKNYYSLCEITNENKIGGGQYAIFFSNSSVAEPLREWMIALKGTGQTNSREPWGKRVRQTILGYVFHMEDEILRHYRSLFATFLKRTERSANISSTWAQFIAENFWGNLHSEIHQIRPTSASTLFQDKCTRPATGALQDNLVSKLVPPRDFQTLRSQRKWKIFRFLSCSMEWATFGAVLDMHVL